MKKFQRGTPAFGLALGAAFVACGALVMWIGFWRTLLLVALFAVGYFLGAVGNKQEFVRETVDKVVPQKKGETIDFRREVQKEQDAMYSAAAGSTEKEEEN